MSEAIFYVTDQRYAPLTLASIASLLQHASSRVKIFIFVINVDERTKAEIRAYCSERGADIELPDLTDDDLGFAFESLPTSRPGITTATYGRLIIPDILKEYETLLYVDGDTLFNADVCELLSIRPKHLAAVEYAQKGAKDLFFYEQNNLPTPQSYFNAGVLLINTKFWIENKISQKCLEYMTNEEMIFPLHDQDILNLIFGAFYHRLDTRWNFVHPFSHKFPILKPFIVHFAGQFRPWDAIEWRSPQVFHEHYKTLFRDFPEGISKSVQNLMFTAEERRKVTLKKLRAKMRLREFRQPRWNPKYNETLKDWEY